MLGQDRNDIAFTLPHMETIRVALSEFPVRIEEREDDSSAEIPLFEDDLDVEIR